MNPKKIKAKCSMCGFRMFRVVPAPAFCKGGHNLEVGSARVAKGTISTPPRAHKKESKEEK